MNGENNLRTKRILPLILTVYLLCFVFRLIEYFLLRTDQSLMGEAFIHKLLGIAVLLITLKWLGISAREIGFVKKGALSGISKGLIFGVCVFFIAYAIEAAILASQGKLEALRLYVSAYAVDANVGNQTAFIFFLICIVGNVINVLMEEGVFRGLFLFVCERKYSFVLSAIITSCLFGLWHIVGPIRNYCDGLSSAAGLTANILMLVITSSLVGFKLCLMRKLTGNLYMPMGDHFVNNTVVNMLHVISSGGADELMFVRITIAQALSFTLVLIWYLRSVRKSKADRENAPE